MLIHTDYPNTLSLPFDDVHSTVADEEVKDWNNHVLEIDGTGKLQIVNTGGSSAAEGGMGSGSDEEKEKGDLGGNLYNEKGGKPNTDPNKGWDPIKENIEENTAKRNDDE